MSGGFSHGGVQVGMLDRIAKEGRDPDGVAGVSVGAINAAALGQFRSLADGVKFLKGLWSTLRTKDVMKHHIPLGPMQVWEDSLMDSRPLARLLQKNLTRTLVRPTLVGSVSYNTGDYRSVDLRSVKNPVQWLVASAGFPGVIAAPEIDQQRWGDGGIRNMTPLADCIAQGATEIDVLLTWPRMSGFSSAPTNYLGFAIRALELALNEIAETDLKLCQARNGAKGYRKVKIRVIRPDGPVAGSAFSFDKKAIKAMLSMGYRVADRALGEG